MISTIFQILLTVLAICLLICFHELGHFLVGMWLGAKPYAFSVGFGPKLFEKRMKKGWILYVRIFPVGGYVSFDNPEEVQRAANEAKEINTIHLECAMKDLQEHSNESQAKIYRKSRAIQSKKRVHVNDLLDLTLDRLSPLKRFCVYVAGPCFNVILAFVLSFVAYMTLGTGQYEPVVLSVVENGPSYGILQEGDVVLSLNGRAVQEGEAMSLILMDELDEMGLPTTGLEEGQSSDVGLLLVVNRDGKEQTLSVTPKWDANAQRWKIGIQQQRIVHHVDIPSYVSNAIADVQWELGGIYEGLVSVLGMQADSNEITGVIGAVDQVQEYANLENMAVFLMLMSLFSANLAVINLLPIPGLDGAKALMTIVEGVTKKRLPMKVEVALTGSCMLALMVLTVVLAVRDVMNIVT